MRKAEREQRAANRRLALLSETANRLLTTESPQEFMRDLFPVIAQELGVEIYFNYLATAEDSPRLKLHSYSGVTPEVAGQIESIEFGEAVCGRVAATRERAIIEDAQRSDDPMLAPIRKMGISAYACHPLVANGRMLGTLSFGSAGRHQFEPEDLDLMQAIANQLAVALDRAHLNTQLQTQAERLRAVLDNTPAVIYVVDAEGRLQVMNREFNRLLGEIKPGTHLREIFPAEATELYLANNRVVLESGNACEFEEPALLPEGWRTYLSIKVPLSDAQGNRTAVCGISTDITRRKKAAEELQERERRIRRLVDSNIVGVMVAGPERIVEANDIFLKSVGYTREDMAAGKLDWLAMTPPEHAAATERAFAELMERGAFPPFEKEYYRKDGSRVPILIGGTLVDDTDQRLCFVLDLSERKRTEAALRDAQKLESLGFLAGGVAHNLNNLLVGIMGNVSLAQSEIPERPVEQERLESALTACERAARLASELLAYAGKGSYFPAPVSVSALIERDMQSVLRSSVPSRVQMRFDLDPQAPELRLDANQIRQVITNLVQNAAEAIDNREGRIEVRTEVRDVKAGSPQEGFAEAPVRPGRYVVLSVSDTGSGMDAETRSKIFDPFFTTKFTGRGLGLSAVAGIARAYEGGVRVTSARGTGSTFEVFLPAPAEAAAVAAVGAGSGRAPRQKRVALVVDDEELVRETVRAALERGGYSVWIAGSGTAAVELMKERGAEVDLVLLDLAMPGMSGEEALGRIRAIRPDVPVAICSGYPEAQVRPIFEGKSVQGFVEKPFTAQTILAAARELAERYSS
jgi:PAS domain S-box-containing protein